MKKNLPINDREVKFSPNINLLSTTDTKGAVIHANGEFCKISGFRREELLGKNHNIVRHPDMPPLAFKNLWETIKQGKSWMGIVKNRCKDGAYYWVNAYVMPIRENGEVVEYQSVRSCPDRSLIARAEKLYPSLLKGKLPLSLRLPRFNILTKLIFANTLCLLPFYACIQLFGAHLMSLLAGFLLSFAAIIIAGFLFAKRIKLISQDASKITGENKLMQFLYTQSQDELGTIDYAIKMQQAELRAIVGRVADTNERLDEAVRATSEMVGDAFIGASEQNMQLQQIASSVNEMSATVAEVAENTNHAASAAKEAQEQTENGGKLIKRFSASMKELVNETEHAMEVNLHLKDRSNDIGTVLDVINNIAEQTNLLALNAAIEAARAGDHGRGFAVVADEVRSLAQRTQQSTQQIKEIIEQLQNDCSQAVEAMKLSKSSADRTMSEMIHVTNSLQAIDTAVNTISHMNAQIAIAAEQQSAATAEVNDKVNAVNAISERTARTSQQTATANERLQAESENQRQIIEQFLLSKL